MKKLKSFLANRFLTLFGLLALLGGLSACGSATGTVDPLTLFNDKSLPTLDPIFSGYSFSSGQAFTSSTPYWVFTGSGSWAGNYIAPAPGFVSSVGQGTFNGLTGFSVTIIHSGRLSTRYIGITPIVRQGDSVVTGQYIGSILGYNLTQVAFQVLLDGQPVCPLSFISDAFKAQTNVYFAAGFLCQ